nr:hypothetical protein [uncultured Psychroserpens sp.]
MNKYLVINAIELARTNKKKDGIRKPSLTDLAEELSDYIDKNENFKLGERSYRDYYNDAKKLEDQNDDISIKQISVINGLCSYLGYNNYKEFTDNLKEKGNEKWLNDIKISIKKNKITLTVILSVLVILIVIKSISLQRWMIWQDDHYVEVKLDVNKYDINQLKVYKEDRILNFKQIIPDCNTKFFKSDGSENLWYGKNKYGELEYFTDYGLHPETGSTLKKITSYMVRKHICETY